MPTYELSISANYVPRWGLLEGAREFFQNALDEHRKEPSHRMIFNYDSATETLIIGNEGAALDIQTLLLGNTTKDSDSSLIGQFGEGYKLATIVFLRNGKKVTIYNPLHNEVWYANLAPSNRYKGALVPKFVVRKLSQVDNPYQPDALIVAIEGLTPSEFEEIKSTNLWLQGIYNFDSKCKYINTAYGNILTDPEFKGHVYVSGLYVCNSDRITYGYDFQPNQLTLDRDRRLVSDIDLLFTTSKLLMLANRARHNIRRDHLPSLYELLQLEDSRYAAMYQVPEADALSIVNEFFEKYGPRAIPVTTQAEFERASLLGFNPITVSQGLKEIIFKSDRFLNMDNSKVIEDTWDKLRRLVDQISDRLTEEERSEFDYIIKVSRHYLMKS